MWCEGSWRSFYEVESATMERVAWLNTHRLIEPLGYRPPAEYEAAHDLTTADRAALILD